MLSTDQSHIIDEIVSSGKHARIRGRAGTGKTYTFKNLIRALKDSDKRTMALTPTGAAACRIEDSELKVYAQTIHRALGLQRPRAYEDNVWPKIGEFYKACALGNKKVVDRLNNIDVLLIDECSMVGSRLFDVMHYIFAKARGREGEFFGGVQVVFCGDFLQLPPVKDSWLFENRYYRAMQPDVHTLSKIMRSDEAEYIEFQNYIRARGVPVFEHSAARSCRIDANEVPDDSLLLVHTNKEVDEHNKRMRLKLFSGCDFHSFPSYDQDGEAIEVDLCKGMRVMALANHPQMDYANSSVGTIERFETDEKERLMAVVKFDEKRNYAVPVIWKDLEWEDDKGKTHKKEYYPLKPAYAATINKIQGITCDSVTVQCQNRADHGRLFVALTRCRTLGGLHLILPDDAAMAFSDKISNDEF